MEHLKQRADLVIKKFIESDTKYSDINAYIFDGGKRLRQMIVFAISESLDGQLKGVDVDNLSLGIEMIHNASLIIDDLPCMDNDDMRRGKKTVHKQYGERLAIQFAMMLVRKALQNIYSSLNSTDNNTQKLYLFNEIINTNLGKNGLPMGQLIDINFLKNKVGLTSKKDYQALIYKKTTTLFNLSFLLTYILYETSPEKIEKMKKASKWFGLTFQLYDDFTDIKQDTNSSTPNYVIKYGVEQAYDMFRKGITKSLLYLSDLGVNHLFFSELFQYLDKIVVKEINSLS
jgi:geranylgeranyl diphosphate synthase type II